MEAIFDVAGKKKAIAKLEEEMNQPDFWNDQEKGKEHGKKIKQYKEDIDLYEELSSGVNDLLELVGLTSEESEGGHEEEFESELANLEKKVEEFEIRCTLSGDLDDSGCFLNIHPGAGGTESCDWADMLLRMYLRWAESRGYKTELIDRQPGDEAGIKNATVHVQGEYAYGYLKAETGIHRLVRISPFDSAGRRHTSFAAVDVIPQIEQDDTVRINESDLRIDTYRASSAGGQHVNKTSSAVRITHIPTGIVVSCQNERSQHLNREVTMQMLRSKLKAILRQEQKEEIEELRGAVKDIAWGNQIRSYVLQPYQLIKDLRTGYETGNTQRVLDGGLEPFILEYLKYEKKEQEAMNNRAK